MIRFLDHLIFSETHDLVFAYLESWWLSPIGRLPEHLLVEIFIRLPVNEWVQIAFGVLTNTTLNFVFFIFCTDQFIACGKTGDKAHELASKIWLALIDGLEENQETFFPLKHLASPLKSEDKHAARNNP